MAKKLIILLILFISVKAQFDSIKCLEEKVKMFECCEIPRIDDPVLKACDSKYKGNDFGIALVSIPKLEQAFIQTLEIF